MLRGCYSSSVEHAQYVLAVTQEIQECQSSSLRNTLSLYTLLVRRARYKLARCLLSLNRLWQPHFTATLEDTGEHLITMGDLPRMITLTVREAATKMETLGICPLSTEADEPLKYSVLPGDVPKWTVALTSTYKKLEDALLNDTMTSAKNAPSARDFLLAAMNLNVLHGLLDSKFYDRLFEEISFSQQLRVSLEARDFGGFYDCMRTGLCKYPAQAQQDVLVDKHAKQADDHGILILV